MNWQSDQIDLKPSQDGQIFVLSGPWTIDQAEKLDALMKKATRTGDQVVALDCRHIDQFDTTGALLVRRFAAMAGSGIGAPIAIEAIPEGLKPLLRMVDRCPEPLPTEAETLPLYLQMLEDIGKTAHLALASLGGLTAFIGLVQMRLLGSFVNPGRLRFTPIVRQMEIVGVRSLGIVGLISLLIGAVIVNQGAIQLARFGADIFVIDMLGISQLRELGILLTAIIVAGRSGSAFTAQLGSMKLNEEVDALRTLGMNAIDVLVLPRFIALVLTLPLLTVFADIVGVFGGAVTAWVQLDIQPNNFIAYFKDAVLVDHFLVGLIKAPFFAGVIAIAGCYQGLTVHGSADSLGAHTTASVVQSIFLVIVLDALFSIFFTAIGL